MRLWRRRRRWRWRPLWVTAQYCNIGRQVAAAIAASGGHGNAGPWINVTTSCSSCRRCSIVSFIGRFPLRALPRIDYRSHARIPACIVSCAGPWQPTVLTSYTPTSCVRKKLLKAAETTNPCSRANPMPSSLGLRSSSPSSSFSCCLFLLGLLLWFWHLYISSYPIALQLLPL